MQSTTKKLYTMEFKQGQRITFKSPTRSGNIKATRLINGTFKGFSVEGIFDKSEEDFMSRLKQLVKNLT